MKRLVFVILLAVLLGGCAAERESYRKVVVDPRRDPVLAAKLNAEALALVEQEQFGDAEKQLKLAIAADAFYAPAHNNLGTLYLRQKKLYPAAWEFEYASKLLPTRAEPVNNLGMVYEAAGWMDEALMQYERAMQLEPGEIEPKANLARLLVRMGRADDRLVDLLKEVSLRDPRPDWAQWARDRLATTRKSSGPASRPEL